MFCSCNQVHPSFYKATNITYTTCDIPVKWGCKNRGSAVVFTYCDLKIKRYICYFVIV